MTRTRTRKAQAALTLALTFGFLGVTSVARGAAEPLQGQARGPVERVVHGKVADGAGAGI